uniref:Reverse transcriptase domain-containing protein n=1 Tax=Meloidogyne enterolobii TaxID=390850 RepID=A0A6V7Y138_MELEN|nr:unnamed protein product [Meloidogyne enterolobii]
MSGIPQGTIIGPVLFLIYINDIIYRIPSPTKTMLFADDLKIFCEFSANNDNACLQESLIKIEEWCIDWALDISLNKTCTFHIGKNNPRKRYILFGTILQTVSSVTDLGITFTDKLSFEAHLTKIIKKAYHRSILVLNNINSSNPKIFSLAFKSYVRPILEYASIIWSPKTKKLILKIEQIQKWFTRIALAKCKISKMNYENRLKFLNLESLVLRRTLFDLSTIFRLTKNFTHLDPTRFVDFSTRPIRNKHNLQLRVPKKISKTEHWIINRSLNLWNVLPIQIINSPNPKSFWINLRHYLIQNQDLVKDFIGQFYQYSIGGNSDSSKNSPLTKKQQLLNSISSLNFENLTTIPSDPNIPEFAKSLLEQQQLIIKQLSGLLKIASELICEKTEPTAPSMEQQNHLLVITGLAESNEERPIDRATSDKNNVLEIFNELEIDRCLPTSIFRMGRQRPPNEKPRPIKVVMPCSAAAAEAIKNKKKLAGGKFKNIIVRRSLTKDELVERASLIERCKIKRNDTGFDFIIYANQIILRSEVHIFKKTLSKNQ